MNVTIAFEGLDKVQGMFDPQRFVQEMDKAVDTAAGVIRDNTKKLPPVSAKSTGYGSPGVPVDTGRMRQSIQKRKLQMLGAEIYADTNYSGFVAYGTSKMPARPFFQWELEDFGGTKDIEIVFNQALDRFFTPS